MSAVVRIGRASAAAVALFVCACSSPALRHHRTVEQPIGTVLRTAVGGVVVRTHNTTDRPDAAGRPDPRYSKVRRGGFEVSYRGMAEDGKLSFAVKEQEIDWSDPRLQNLPPVPYDASADLSDPRNPRFGSIVVEVIEATPEALTYRLREQ